MLGKPKYKVGNAVKFIFGNELKTGIVFVVDKYGTFDNSTDVSYDILVEDENVLYKHIQEKHVVQRCYKMKLKSWTENGENILKQK